MVWEIVFMLVILKIPVVYLCVVIWWAIKPVPAEGDLADAAAVLPDTPPPSGGHGRRRARRMRPDRPHSPGRSGSSPPHSARVRA
jgi:hypothetical protein